MSGTTPKWHRGRKSETNYGSFGTIPKMVQEYQRQLQLETEARPDTFIRYTYPKLLKESRSAVAPLLGADPGEVVIVPNATTGVNTVLRNVSFDEGDVILCFDTIYGACAKTIQALSETCLMSSHQISITYPIDDDEIVLRFRLAAEEELDIMSLIDGAHGIGHVDLTHLGKIGPDFMISNCYKWLMVPRGCAVLYVSFRNQKLISSTLPTSWGYEARDDRAKMDPREYFSVLFDKVSTTDNTPYCCTPLALKFRSVVCGGEAKIRKYCEDIARQGGARMAEILDTEVLGASTSSFQRCCFTNVRLPLTLEELGIHGSSGRLVAKWMQELTPAEYETYLPIKFYGCQVWCRISGQIYLTLDDFEWAARTLLQLCERAKKGEWA
ncbi:aminotransferase family protein-like protein [Podospora didyma]|uniref:Aminotransferase family protein-like protein n=1 Tax=Podospora didyma TaxID=330526 RepID=A0AAE0U8Q7_9PEZI|nr:aminotransferase family protein-like protein [Podospora didyma]